MTKKVDALLAQYADRYTPVDVMVRNATRVLAACKAARRRGHEPAVSSPYRSADSPASLALA